jgi:hypothetical protein
VELLPSFKDGFVVQLLRLKDVSDLIVDICAVDSPVAERIMITFDTILAWRKVN